MNLQSPLVESLIKLAVEEDLVYGDVTAESTIPESTIAHAKIVSRERLVVCGLPLITKVAHTIDPTTDVVPIVIEGSEVDDETVLAVLEGSAISLLKTERVVLNFLQRLSGIATEVRRIVKPLTRLTVLDTRKTTPGWRVLEKYAVRTGGGANHRSGLGDMLLVKNNHIDANGGSVERTLELAFENKPFYCPVEVEVRSMDELKAALTFPIDVVLLDNMSNKEMEEALIYIKAQPKVPLVEASGGITPERLASLEALGVDAVSMGALTTKATNVDISVRMSQLS